MTKLLQRRKKKKIECNNCNKKSEIPNYDSGIQYSGNRLGFTFTNKFFCSRKCKLKYLQKGLWIND